MNVAHTSAECYHSRTFHHKAHTDRDLIAQLVRQRGPMTRREISAFLSMETGSVAGRVNELLNAEPPVLVELDNAQPCPITKRRVNWLIHADCAPGMQMGMAI